MFARMAAALLLLTHSSRAQFKGMRDMGMHPAEKAALKAARDDEKAKLRASGKIRNPMHQMHSMFFNAEEDLPNARDALARAMGHKDVNAIHGGGLHPDSILPTVLWATLGLAATSVVFVCCVLVNEQRKKSDRDKQGLYNYAYGMIDESTDGGAERGGEHTNLHRRPKAQLS